MEDSTQGEQMWIRINNEKIDIRVGLVYAPQESRTKAKDLRIMYDKMEEQIIKGRNRNQKVLIVGDLNCKIGKEINGNKDIVTKGGRMLLKLVKDQDMEIVNANTNKCKGLWTRAENGSKSVLDYVLVNKEHLESIEKMVIDEKREITPYSQEGAHAKRTYTDHNMIKVEKNWVTTSMTEKRERLVLNNKAKESFNESTEKGKLADIWKTEGNLQNKYNQWNEKVKEIAKKHFTTDKRKKKPINKTIRKLRRKKRLLKEKEGSTDNASITKARIRLIEEFIEEEKIKQERSRVITIAKNIKKEKGFNGNAFWELSKRMQGRKSETVTAMYDESGNLEEDPAKIKEIYKTFYEKLLKDREPENSMEKEVQELKEKCISVMMEKAKNEDIEEITNEEYEVMKKRLKKNKAPDEEGWRYEWIAHAGKNLEESIKLMLNTTVTEKSQPDQWKYMRIKSTTKKARKRMYMDFKRGLFLTNILSKCMETLMLNRRKGIIDRSMQPFQNGGVTLRSIADIHFMINNTVAEFKYNKKDLYILFGDLEKCFDKLYLKDCIIELVEAGMPLEEAMYVYDMNRQITAVVDTPHGRTDEFEIEEAVRQGTVFGSTMCGVSTNRINKMGRPDPLILYDSIEIECPIFIDDISGMGTVERIENVGEKMAGLETTKKFQFSNEKDKTEYMVMKNNNKEKERTPRIEVRKGKINKTKEYKCVGDYYDESGNNELKIKKKMEKSNYMAYETKRRGAYTIVGHAYMSVQLLLLEMTVKPALLANTETWCNITSTEETMITSHHHQVLCIIFGQPKSTPYWGICGETGIWPYKYVIIYKKLMFLHHIVNSTDDRIAKRIVKKQEELVHRKTWYSELYERVEPMKINIKTNELEELTKSAWKSEVKEKLHQAIEKEFHQETNIKTKMCFQHGKNFKMEEYVETCDAEMVKKIMQIRLNMVECKSNYRGCFMDSKCLVCNEEETTEHLFKCKHYQRFTGISEIQMDSPEWLMKAARMMDTIQEIRKQHSSVNYPALKGSNY